MRKTVTKLFAFVFSLAVFLLASASVFPQASQAQALFAPSAPLNVTAVTADSGEITISFFPPADNGGSPITGYIISSPPLANKLVSPSDTSYTWTGLDNGTPYVFSVSAQNSAGTSPAAKAVPSPITPTSGEPTAKINVTFTSTKMTMTGQLIHDNNRSGISILYGLSEDNLDQSFPLTVSPSGSLSGSSTVPLKPNTTYYYVPYDSNLNTEEESMLTSVGRATTQASDTGTTTAGGGSTTTGGDGTSAATNPNDIRIRLDNPLGGTRTLPDFMLKVIDAAILLLTPIVVMMLIYSGFLFVSARGNAEELGKAKQALMYTLIGAAIVLGAKGLALVIQAAIGCIAGAAGC